MTGAEEDRTPTKRWTGRRAGGALAVAAILVTVACFSGDPVSALPDECRELARAAGVAEGAVVVGIRSFSFVPSRLTVEAGTEITWVNCEPPDTPDGEHTSTSDPGSAASWGSELLARGEIYQRTFDRAGESPYHCEPHPFMTGTIVVE